MTQEIHQKITEALQSKFGNAISSVDIPYEFLTFTLPKESLLETIAFLYHNESLSFQFLTDICAVHYPEKSEKFQVVYHLHSLTNNYRIRLKSNLNGNSPEIDSLTGIFPSANWMERETFDFYGILFKGHPNLKRILNVDDMLIHPMRKEFPLEDQVRLDKNDSMFGR